MQLRDNIKWAVKETNKVLPPYKRVEEDWLFNWFRTLDAINSVTGVFEISAIVFSRCEFLGSLYAGKLQDSNAQEFKDFINRFFVEDYSTLHNVSESNKVSDIFNAFRNNVLHSGTATTIQKVDGSLIGWWIGYNVNSDGRGMVFRDESMYIDCINLVEEFKVALKRYIEYLKMDSENLKGNGIPSIRWKKGFWYSLKPVYCDCSKWVSIGYEEGLF